MSGASHGSQDSITGWGRWEPVIWELENEKPGVITLWRAKVPGGWICKAQDRDDDGNAINVAVCFVPEPSQPPGSSRS